MCLFGNRILWDLGTGVGVGVGRLGFVLGFGGLGGFSRVKVIAGVFGVRE